MITYVFKRPSSAQRGYGHRWRKARLRFLRANPLCRLCKERGLIVPATEVDHITPKEPKDMGFWNISNWQALCEYCHKSKTARFDKPGKHKIRVDGNRGPRRSKYVAQANGERGESCQRK